MPDRSLLVHLGFVCVRKCGGIAGACLAAIFSFATTGCSTGHVASGALPGSSSASTAAAAANQPVLGYAWDSSHAGLRAMLGVPGAASLSNTVVSQGSFTSATLCLRKNFALLTSSTGSVYVESLPGGVPLVVTAQVMSGQQIVVSPSCSKALVYKPGSSTGVLLSGLPSDPQLEALSFATSGSISGAAVGDLGDVGLAMLRSDGSTTVQLLPPSGSMSAPLLNLQNYGAMTFVPGADTMLVADSAANKVWMLAPSSSTPGPTALASSSDGVSMPLAISSSADGHTAFVANRTGAPLLRLDLVASIAPAKVACACRPSELIPLPGNALFQLSDLSSGTVYVLDASQTLPKTLFIPASHSVSMSGAWQ